MSKKKRRSESLDQPQPDGETNGDALIPDEQLPFPERDAGEAGGTEDPGTVLDAMETALLESEMMCTLDDVREQWWEAFRTQYGREPTREEWKKSFLEVAEEIEAMSEEELEAALEEAGAALDGPLGLESPLTPEDFLARCGWCGAEVDHDHAVHSIGIRFGVNWVAGREGTVIALPLLAAEREVPAFVVPQGSPAADDGWDALLMICSLECAQALRSAFAAEKALAGSVLSN